MDFVGPVIGALVFVAIISSFGCMIFDALIAIWFLTSAPSFVRRTQALVAALD